MDKISKICRLLFIEVVILYKAIVLSSGGLDSTTCISLAIQRYGIRNVSTVSFFYGQKHGKELECAKKIANYYGLKHYELDISNLLKYSNCPLLQKSTEKIEHKSYSQQIKENGEGMVKTYVPFRNGLLLSVVATLAMSLYENTKDHVYIYIGNHADDCAGNAYADCSVEFIDSINKAINIGTYGKVSIMSPFKNKTKADIVATGIRLKTPYQLTWSCYEGREKPCGTCGTCIDRAEAFKKNSIKDPAL